MSRRRALACALSVFLVTLAGCRADSPAALQQRFAVWRQVEGAARVDRYPAWLARQGVGDVAPAHALLRSSRRWRACGAAEFALPPESQWPAMVPTLRLLRQLQAQGLADASRIRSGYREPALNTCSGGSTRSRHLRNNALDLDLAAAPDTARRLCTFWREHGRNLRMGLGFYSPEHIHVDTGGFRTWGRDFTRRTSLCVESSL